MLNGWSTRTAQELDATIRTWAEIFAKYQIPSSAYGELYQRAFDVRQSRMRTHQDAPQMDATLLVSQWTGEWGLKAALRQREIDAGRTLTSNAESTCPKCHGTGFENIKDENGNHLGVKSGCTH